MAKDRIWRLKVIISLVFLFIAGFVLYMSRRKPIPDSIIGQYRIPAGLNSFCGIDKDGLMIHMKIIVYDSQGNYVAHGNPSDPYACVSIPGMKAGDYWVRLFK